MKAGWNLKPLGEVCTLQRGFDLPTQERRLGAYPLVSSSGVIDTHDEGPVSGPGVVTGRSGSIGNVFYIEGSFWPLNTTLYVRDFFGNDPRFVHHLLTGFDLKRFAGGTGVPTLNRNDVHSKSVLMPPDVGEQRRIVAILDEAFEAIATAKANTEKNLQNTFDLQSALAQECFDAHVDASFKPRPLAELCDLIVDCEHKTAPTQDLGFPSIRTPNIGKGELILDNVNRVSEETYKAWTRRAVPVSGDLILAREAPAGNVAVIPPGLKVCLGQRTVLIRPKREVFEPEYLAYLLLQRNSQDRLLAHSRGATVQHVNLKDIRAFMISHVPALDVQRRAISRMTEVQEQGQSLADLASRKLAALDELKKSLLHQAFTGALTAKSTDQQVAEFA